MSLAVEGRDSSRNAPPWGYLPPRLRILAVSGDERTGRWLYQAFASDGACDVSVDQVAGMSEGVMRLRDETFDAVLISHEPPDLDALELLDAICAGAGGEQAVIVLGSEPDADMVPLCLEANAEAYVCVPSATTRALLWTIARAVERRRLLAENRRWRADDARRQERERDEAQRLLTQQLAIVAGGSTADRDAIGLRDPDASRCSGADGDPCDAAVFEQYREFLRSYVIMGSGRLGEEVARLACQLTASRLSARQVLLLHVHVLEEMIQGLGTRSARHVMNRADLLLLELILQLAETYRRQTLPPRQLLLAFGDEPARETDQRPADRSKITR